MKTIITYTNPLGESIVFNKFGSSFLASSIEGFGGTPAGIQFQKAPYQDGTTFIDALMENRPLSFQVTIRGESVSDVSMKREQLARVFNPKLGLGTLKVQIGTRIRVIQAIAENVPTFPSGVENRGYYHQIGLINLIAPEPYWKSTTVTEEPTFEPKFHFPIRGPFIMGIQRDTRNIVNDGDVPAPLQVEFFGPALNPKIMNMTTGEFIKINQELLEGERMMIDTSDNVKSVYFVDESGVERNVFNWIDLESTFFKLAIGQNQIEYTADSDIQGAIVNITYQKQYQAI